MFYNTIYTSPIGKLFLLSDGNNLNKLDFLNSKDNISIILNDSKGRDDLPIFAKTKKWLDDYFKGKNPTISDLPLSPKGSAFQEAVWDILRGIPYGKTTTYGAIAKEIAKQMGKSKMSAQAVGGAVGKNPIAIIIPCHRVIGVNGNLTGYSAGIDKKIKLLEIERLGTLRSQQD